MSLSKSLLDSSPNASPNPTIRVGIIGAAGYSGLELLRILLDHPNATPACVTSRSLVGQAVTDTFASLRGRTELKFVAAELVVLRDCDVVFAATPSGVAMQYAPGLLEAGVKFIDLSADFRLKDPAIWEKWYAQTHACPDLLAQAVYGLPETQRTQICDADLVANPGCYPTAVLLGFLPLLENDLVTPNSLVADAKSGVSGAGRQASLTTAFAEMGESFKAYAVSGHRHLPEIRQQLQRISGQSAELVFTPHLVPMIRGIHATLYARLNPAHAENGLDLQDLYARRFGDEPFVDILAAGGCPDTRSVRGSNTCRIAVHRPQGGDRVVVLTVIDNLVKGAAGQAIQNMNLMFGLPETAGLAQLPLLP